MGEYQALDSKHRPVPARRPSDTRVFRDGAERGPSPEAVPDGTDRFGVDSNAGRLNAAVKHAIEEQAKVGNAIGNPRLPSDSLLIRCLVRLW